MTNQRLYFLLEGISVARRENSNNSMLQEEVGRRTNQGAGWRRGPIKVTAFKREEVFVARRRSLDWRQDGIESESSRANQFGRGYACMDGTT